MAEPITPEQRLAEIRDLRVDSCSADAPYSPDVWALESARRDLLAEVDRLNAQAVTYDRLNRVAIGDWEREVDHLKAELAEMESAAADWAARLADLRSKAETRLAELADIERSYRKVGNKAGAARQDYAAAEIRALFGIEWQPGGAS